MQLLDQEDETENPLVIGDNKMLETRSVKLSFFRPSGVIKLGNDFLEIF